MNKAISWNEIQEQICHWLECPENGYHGSDYGYRDSIAENLKSPPNDIVVQETILKMRNDLDGVLVGKNLSLTWVAGTKQITITVDSDTAIFPIHTPA